MSSARIFSPAGFNTPSLAPQVVWTGSELKSIFGSRRCGVARWNRRLQKRAARTQTRICCLRLNQEPHRAHCGERFFAEPVLGRRFATLVLPRATMAAAK